MNAVGTLSLTVSENVTAKASMPKAPSRLNATTSQTTTATSVADTVLTEMTPQGEIAEFIFGERGSRRKVYYLPECSRLPVFRLGSVLCARKSVLLQWISGQESRVIRQ
jgi:hypothetical protein